jgi:hypothetical protein
VSVDFEPVRIGGRRPMIDPLVVAAVAVVVALVVAIAKPWESNRSGASPLPAAMASTPAASAGTSTPTATPHVRSTRPPGTTPGLLAPTWADVADAVGDHGVPGVLAVMGHVNRFTIEGGAPVDYGSLWTSREPGSEDPINLLPGDDTVWAMGLTFLAGEAPDDIRFWHVRGDGDFDGIDTGVIEPPGADEPRLYVQRGTSSAGIDPWRPGSYRIDILRAGRIERLVVRLADPSGAVPFVDRPATSETRLVAASDSDPSAVRIGLFATVDGLGVSFDVATSRPLDEAEAWMAANVPPAGGQAPVVARAFLPRATGLGVMLTSDASVELAVMRRLSPISLAPTPPARGGISNSQGRTPYVVFAASDGQALTPGVYAISVSWTDGAGLHAATWHVELRPGPVARD